MNACESSKIYTSIIILLHAKFINLLLFHPGLGPALVELKFGVFLRIVHTLYIYRISSFHQHCHSPQIIHYHAYTGIKPDFSYEKPWYKHGLEVNWGEPVAAVGPYTTYTSLIRCWQISGAVRTDPTSKIYGIEYSGTACAGTV